MGTYNYGNDSEISHVIKDIIPYNILKFANVGEEVSNNPVKAKDYRGEKYEEEINKTQSNIELFIEELKNE